MAYKHPGEIDRFRHFAPAWWCGLVLVGLIGCDAPEIKKYSAPREKVVPDLTRLESYKLPESWTRISNPAELSAANPSFSPPLAAFEAGAGDKKVIVTINRLPAMGGNLVANINRWRGQAGLPEVNEEAINKELLWLKVDGEKTPYVDLLGKKKEAAHRILGVVATHGPVAWFFKMYGPPELIGQQKAAFEAFVESVKFGGTGANDG